MLDEVERWLIIKRLKETGYNQVLAAELLGIGEGTLRYKQSRFGIDRRALKRAAKAAAEGNGAVKEHDVEGRHTSVFSGPFQDEGEKF